MRAVNAVLVGMLLVSLGVEAEARSLRASGGPAEIPPTSFTGTQYVDSEGCAFIRAGYGGSVQWVPRVSRNKQVICGMTPSLGRTARAAPAKPQVARPRLVLRPNGASVTAKPRAMATRPRLLAGPARAVITAPPGQTRKIQKRAPFPLFAVLFGRPKPALSGTGAPAPTVFGTTYKKPAVIPVARQPRAYGPRRQVAGITTTGITTTGITATGITATGMEAAFFGGQSSDIRRGPQAVHPGDYFNGRLGRNGVPFSNPAARGNAAPAGAPLRIVVQSSLPVVPAGYKSLLTAANDASRSGVGTSRGQAAMDLIWTQTMPRRLIDVTTGSDVTTKYTQIRYPYTSARVSTRSYVPAGSARLVHGPRRKRLIKDPAAPSNMTGFSKISDVSASDPGVSRIAAKGASGKPRTGRFIQVATFGVPANATRTMARFRLKGMPTASRGLRLRGKSYDIVLLGPFADEAGVRAALNSAVRAGFSDAFLVR